MSFKVGDKVEALNDIWKPGADADTAFPEDHPEWVDVRRGRRGTVVEVTNHGEARVRWSHRKDIAWGWFTREHIRLARPTSKDGGGE